MYNIEGKHRPFRKISWNEFCEEYLNDKIKEDEEDEEEEEEL